MSLPRSPGRARRFATGLPCRARKRSRPFGRRFLALPLAPLAAAASSLRRAVLGTPSPASPSCAQSPPRRSIAGSATVDSPPAHAASRCLPRRRRRSVLTPDASTMPTCHPCERVRWEDRQGREITVHPCPDVPERVRPFCAHGIPEGVSPRYQGVIWTVSGREAVRPSWGTGFSLRVRVFWSRTPLRFMLNARKLLAWRSGRVRPKSAGIGCPVRRIRDGNDTIKDRSVPESRGNEQGSGETVAMALGRHIRIGEDHWRCIEALATAHNTSPDQLLVEFALEALDRTTLPVQRRGYSGVAPITTAPFDPPNSWPRAR